MISVLVVDDSVLIRKRISRLLNNHRRIEVVGTASDGLQAIEMIKKLKPDVVTLDVEMPNMNGIEALRVITREFDVPVLMLSALTKEGADVTMTALEMGAVDFICKPRFGSEDEMKEFERDLTLKIRAAALTKDGKNKTSPVKSAARASTSTASPATKSERSFVPSRRAVKSIVAIGVSTGGPKALVELIPKIPADFPAPIIIAQHMPKGFTASLAARLDGLSAISVKEARNGETMKEGTCYLAPGSFHLTVMHMTLSKGVMIKISDTPKNSLYKPSVDIMIKSVAEVYGAGGIGVILTGMGTDGTKGAKDLKDRGGMIIAEDKSTCTVYGMPRSVVESGLADIVAPLFEIPAALKTLLMGN